jgi:hypothetical protein
MATENKQILQIEGGAANIQPGQISIESTPDAFAVKRALAWRDHQGVVGVALARDEAARVSNIRVTGKTAGVATLDADGDVGTIGTLAALNTELGSNIDEADAARTPTDHADTHAVDGSDPLTGINAAYVQGTPIDDAVPDEGQILAIVGGVGTFIDPPAVDPGLGKVIDSTIAGGDGATTLIDTLLYADVTKKYGPGETTVYYISAEYLFTLASTSGVWDPTFLSGVLRVASDATCQYEFTGGSVADAEYINFSASEATTGIEVSCVSTSAHDCYIRLVRRVSTFKVLANLG